MTHRRFGTGAEVSRIFTVGLNVQWTLRQMSWVQSVHTPAAPHQICRLFSRTCSA